MTATSAPTPAPRRTPTLLDVRRIYVEPAAAELPRGQQVLARWPDAERVEVESHWRIPELHGDEANVARWTRIKTEALVLGVKKSLSARPNGRSSDFVAPSTANGCAMACAYCYVPRRKGYSNPITVFANIEQVTRYLERHVGRQGTKPAPDQVDPAAWVYDIGENSTTTGCTRSTSAPESRGAAVAARPAGAQALADRRVERPLPHGRQGALRRAAARARRAPDPVAAGPLRLLTRSAHATGRALSARRRRGRGRTARGRTAGGR